MYVLLVPVLAAFMWIALKLYGQYSDSNNYEPVVDSFSVISAQQVNLRLQVSKADTDPAVCRVQATDQQSNEVGYAQISVPAGGDVQVDYSLKTSARAFSVSVLGCSAG
ncbi:hypothetical protein GCM10023322_61430 [Rugosimonospora acidiphila]|uniref:DUF4307 domain-containing protein n=1 Tax=Rugosimonospora acidiphila TaxID=556531 RepID=A0ABP9SHV8_9ACTN